MRRPPSVMARAMTSMARAMFGSACETAGMTFLSASLMMRAICSGASVSSISLARLRCSVESARRSTVGFELIFYLLKTIYLRRLLKTLYNGVVKNGTGLLDLLRAAVRPGPVGQQRDGELALGIAPERGAGVAEVSVGMWGEVFAGLRGGRGCVPTEGARGSGGPGLPCGEELYSFRAEDRRAVGEHAVGEA